MRKGNSTRYLAMWSGPRNISTAMMRSFGNRPGTRVVDEPFYAHYLLKRPDVDHPGRDEIIQSHETDPQHVIQSLIKPLAEGIQLCYQKHMCKHMIEGVPLDWMNQCTHVFLIRDPKDVVRSFSRVVPDVSQEDIGLVQQHEMFRKAQEASGEVPLVVDSDDILLDPRGVLEKVCDRLNLEFMDSMLHWERGPRPYDGVWARYWYDNVNASTGFARRTLKNQPVDPRYNDLIAESRILYQELASHRLS